MTKHHPTSTVAEALARSITELQQLIATVGPETNLGLALTTVKGALQRIDQGLPASRDHWLSVAAALQRAQGGSQ